MTATVRPTPLRVNYVPNATVNARIAAEFDLRPASVEQMLKPSFRSSWPHRLATSLRIMVDAGQRERALVIAQPVFDALDEGPAPELTNALVLEENDTDSALDVARARYMLDPSDDHAHAYIAALHRHENKERLLALAMRGMQSA